MYCLDMYCIPTLNTAEICFVLSFWGKEDSVFIFLVFDLFNILRNCQNLYNSGS